MTVKVYSAARATFPMETDREAAWRSLTATFKSSTAVKDFNYFLGHILEPVNTKPSQDRINVGDVFRRYGSDIYVKITKWEPFKNFSYLSGHRPTSGPDVGSVLATKSGTALDVTLESHVSGITLVSITKRIKGDFTWLDYFTDMEDTAAEDLRWICTRTRRWEKGETTRGNITVVDDNELKVDFTVL